MKAIIPIAILVAAMIILSFQPLDCGFGPGLCSERPTVNLPVALRQSNWFGAHGGGSCFWASLVSDCNWSGLYDKAKAIRAHHGDGVSTQSAIQGLRSEGIPFVYTEGKHDMGFLETALAGRRAPLIAIHESWMPANEDHCVLLAYLDQSQAAFIDNNHISEDRWISREYLEQIWDGADSLAIVTLLPPMPPLAH